MKEIIKQLESAFEEVVSIAYDNAPDYDDEIMEEFEDGMQTAQNDFKKAIEQLKAGGFSMTV